MGESTSTPREVYLFGSLRLDVPAHRLTRAGEPVPLPPKAFELLLALVRNCDRAMTRGELIDILWGDTIVEEGNLAWNVKELRRLLGPDGADAIETIRGYGYRFALAVEREEATAAAIDLGPKPESTPPADAPVLPGRRPRRIAPALLALLTLLIAALALGWFAFGRRPGAAVPPAATGGRALLAVLPFADLSQSSESAWLSTAIAEVLGSELALSNGVVPIAGETVVEEFPRAPQGGSLGPEARKRLRGALGAELAVAGSYLVVGDPRQLRVDAALYEVASGSRLATWSESGTVDQLLPLLARGGGALRAELDRRSAGGALGEAIGWRASGEAVRRYAEGLDAARALSDREAIAAFEAAIAASPEFAQAHDALAGALDRLGYEERALASARHAASLAAGLPEAARARIEARAAALAGEWTRAIPLYRRLADAASESVDAGLQLAAALSEAGEHAESAAELDRLAGLPEPGGSDPRIELQRGWTARRAGDFAAMRAAGERAEAAGRRGRSPALLAEALVLRASAAQASGEAVRGIEACDEAARVARAAGHGRLEASALTLCAWLRLSPEDTSASERGFREALELARRTGNLSQVASSLNGLATIALEGGRIAEASTRTAEALAVARESGVIDNEIDALRMLSLCARLAGDLDGALRHAEAGLGRARASRFAPRIALLAGELGRVHVERGDAAAAERAFAESAAAAPEPTGTDRAIQAISAGYLRLLVGDAPGAIALAESVIGAARAAERPEVAEGYALLAEAAADAADAALAARAADELGRAIGTRPSVLTLGWSLARARALGASGRTAEAEAELVALRDRAEWRELAGVRIEAELRLAELALAAGRPGAAAALEAARARVRTAKLGRLLREEL